VYTHATDPIAAAAVSVSGVQVWDGKQLLPERPIQQPTRARQYPTSVQNQNHQSSLPHATPTKTQDVLGSTTMGGDMAAGGRAREQLDGRVVV